MSESAPSGSTINASSTTPTNAAASATIATTPTASIATNATPSTSSASSSTAAQPSTSTTLVSPASTALVTSPPLPTSIRGVPAGLKVLVNFRATGSAPIMKKTKFTLSASHRFGMIIEWLRKTLHFKSQDALYVFCNAAFAPNPDSSMYDLYQCYQVQGELVINYAIQDAWG